MRHLAVVLGLLALPAATPALAQSEPRDAGDSIEVVSVPGRMYYVIQNGGVGRYREGGTREVQFPVSRSEFARIRGLLRNYRAAGLPCDAASPNLTPYGGYLVWREGGQELRREDASPCYTPAHRELRRSYDRAWNLVSDWAEQREIPPPALPDPQSITFGWNSWGRPISRWTLNQDGTGIGTNPNGQPETITATPQDFQRLRELFRPYEGRIFRCQVTVTDGAYGAIVWSQPGHEDQSVGYNAGCMSGDANDIMERLDRAETLMHRLQGYL